jgi:hypothetical protein
LLRSRALRFPFRATPLKVLCRAETKTVFLQPQPSSDIMKMFLRCFFAVVIALVAMTSAHADTSIYEPQCFGTLAGSVGTSGPLDGSGNAAQFNQPWGVAVASDGTLYVADTLNHSIRKITPAGVVTLLAGTPGTNGFADNANPLLAQFDRPTGVAADALGNVYVADYNNQRIRKIDASGVVTTVAGSATIGTNDGTGAAAEFHNPFGVALNSTATLIYVSDQNSQTIRQITLPGGVVTTYAGISGGGYTNGPKATAAFNTPGASPWTARAMSMSPTQATWSCARFPVASSAPSPVIPLCRSLAALTMVCLRPHASAIFLPSVPSAALAVWRWTAAATCM